MRTRRAIAVALLATAAAGATALVLTVAPAVASTPAPASAAAGSITVTGQAQVSAASLHATFSVGVDQQAATAQAALAADDQAMRQVIAALEKQGVPAHDLQTENLSVNPQYQQNANTPGPGRITGFDANDTLMVTLTDTSKVGATIDAALKAGANSLNGVSFVAAHPRQLERQALAAAVADARAQALALASAAGLTLGSVTSINTQVQGTEPVFGAVMAASVPSPQTPVLSGNQSVSAQVTVVFATRAG